MKISISHVDNEFDEKMMLVTKINENMHIVNIFRNFDIASYFVW